jgi:excisionase family DNA binding protein
MQRLLTLSEVMDALRVSRSTVFRLVRTGELRATFFGRRLLFRQADVGAMVARRVRDQRRARQPIGKHV